MVAEPLTADPSLGGHDRPGLVGVMTSGLGRSVECPLLCLEGRWPARAHTCVCVVCVCVLSCACPGIPLLSLPQGAGSSCWRGASWMPVTG